MQPTTPLQRAAAVAARQYSLLTTRDARGCGLSYNQLTRLERECGWQRLSNGLYALPGSVPSWRRDVMAAVLLAGDDAVASHLTAAALWGLVPPPRLPHVTVPLQSSARTRLALVHRSAVPLVDRAKRDGIPCSSASRALVECAALVDRPTLAELVDDLLCRGDAAPASVLRALDRAGRNGRRGVTSLEGVLETWTEDIRPGSPAEMRLLRRLQDLGLAPVTQHTVLDVDGSFVARLDVAVPEVRTAFEYDSDRFHNPRHWSHDEHRVARVTALGWTVHGVSKVDLLPSSTRLADLVGQMAPVARAKDSAATVGPSHIEPAARARRTSCSGTHSIRSASKLSAGSLT
jgi:hypothetical protein